MNGGNDGLNMVVPLDRYTELGNARPGLLMPSASVLQLAGTTTTGLHPAMTGLRDLFDNGSWCSQCLQKGMQRTIACKNRHTL
jgi:uncharacterized protein (DUF1501 family)